jgi:hypothetical protein
MIKENFLKLTITFKAGEKIIKSMEGEFKK